MTKQPYRKIWRIKKDFRKKIAKARNPINEGTKKSFGRKGAIIMTQNQWNSFIFGNSLAFSVLLIVNNFWAIGKLVYLPLAIVMLASLCGMIATAKKKKGGKD